MKKTKPRKPKNLISINNDEANDIWSAISVWQKHLDHNENPLTSKALEKLTSKIRKHLRTMESKP